MDGLSPPTYNLSILALLLTVILLMGVSRRNYADTRLEKQRFAQG